jgi:uncharacterized metal-binding protein
MGVTHRTINTFASLPLTAEFYLGLHRSPTESLAFFAGYTFATFLMNPDLYLNSEGYQSWGFLRFYWWPYQKALAHRCFLSHFPIISTIFRIIYLLWLPILLIFVLGSAVQASARDQVYDWVPQLAPYLIAIVIGMMGSDTLHMFLDVTSTRLKRTFGGRHKRRHEGFFEHHGQQRRSRYNRGWRTTSRSSRR